MIGLLFTRLNNNGEATALGLNMILISVLGRQIFSLMKAIGGKFTNIIYTNLFQDSKSVSLSQCDNATLNNNIYDVSHLKKTRGTGYTQEIIRVDITCNRTELHI